MKNLRASDSKSGELLSLKVKYRYSGVKQSKGNHGTESVSSMLVILTSCYYSDFECSTISFTENKSDGVDLTVSYWAPKNTEEILWFSSD